MSRPAACSWQVLEPGDAQGNWVRKNQHLAEDFPAARLVFSLACRGCCGIYEAQGIARENKGEG